MAETDVRERRRGPAEVGRPWGRARLVEPAIVLLLELFELEFVTCHL